MESVDDLIYSKVNQSKKNTMFFIGDFDEFGSPGAVRVALHRLVKRGVLERVARGIYVRPETSKMLNMQVLPDVDEVARAIAKRDRARIRPTGSYALYALGLSTQVPMNVVYYTDGKARVVKIGNRKITFKKGSPKKLAYTGRLSKLVILAMSEIGKGKVTQREEKKLLEYLKKEDIDDLKHDIKLAPQWIAEFMAKAVRK